jgi:hypothetical protein
LQIFLQPLIHGFFPYSFSFYFFKNYTWVISEAVVSRTLFLGPLLGLLLAILSAVLFAVLLATFLVVLLAALLVQVCIFDLGETAHKRVL